MELKPGYKQTEVGAIPEDWDLKPTTTFASILTGPFGTLLKASEYSEVDGVPLISVGEIRDGYFRVTEETPRISDKVIKRLPQYVLESGDIVFARKGGVERSALIREQHHGWFLGSDGIRLRPFEGVRNEYVALQFQGRRVQRWLLLNSIGTTMPSLNQEILRRVIIPFPPTRGEEAAIANALDEADALCESLECLLVKKRNVKLATAQALLSGAYRLPGFSSRWEATRLGGIGAFYKGKGLPKSAIHPSGTIPCIHYGELFTSYPETIREIISYTEESEGSFRSKANDVLMPTSDVTPNGLAKASCVGVDGVVLGGDILVIRPDAGELSGSFLSYVIRHEEHQVLQLVTGTTVFHLYAKDMRNFRFLKPFLPEQVAIVTVLDDMDAEITALEAKRDKLKLIKQGMMQQLLTGQIRVVPPAAAAA